MNVNGLACSIDMYFGVDVLTRNNQFNPIQWKRFDDKEKNIKLKLLTKTMFKTPFEIN